MDVWLRTNRRALLLGMIPPALVGVIGICLVAEVGPSGGWAVALGWVLLVPSALILGLLAWQTRRPRLAYENGHLLAYLRGGGPLRIPLDVVECFLFGHGPSHLPGDADERLSTTTVVIRLSARAEEWKHGEVNPSLGHWCDSHITIRGTWCEPLDVDVVRRLNAKLADVTRQSSRHAPRDVATSRGA